MITEAQIFLTRRCNLNCGYCKLVKNLGDEFGLDDWIKTYKIMEKLGIKTVKLMGGEPTIKNWLPDLLRFASTTSIKTAILSNSSFDEMMIYRLVEAGLWGYFASIDCLEQIVIDKDPVKKTRNGYRVLRKLQKLGVPLLAANVVVNKINISQIPSIVMQLSNEGFYINLCTIQHTDDPTKEFSKTNIKKDYLFIEENKKKLEILSKQLLMMKKVGYKIAVPNSYIEGISTYGYHCNWQCTELIQLRIDSDGGLMLCNEYRTKLADNYNILKMTEEKYKEFLSQWYVARKGVNCDGCYWSCFLQAEDNIKNKKLEFEYVA